MFSHLCAPYGIHPFLPHVSQAGIFWLLPAGSCLCLWIIWSVHLLMASRAVSSRDKCPISVPLLKSRACHPVWYKERWIYLDCIRPEVLWSGDFLPRFFKYLQYHLGSICYAHGTPRNFLDRMAYTSKQNLQSRIILLFPHGLLRMLPHPFRVTR